MGTRLRAGSRPWDVGVSVEDLAVNDPDRVKLLHGPYYPPELRRGSRAFRLLRNCTVVITGRTDSRISWPSCRALDN